MNKTFKPLSASQYKQLIEESAMIINKMDLLVAKLCPGSRSDIKEVLCELRSYFQCLPHGFCDHGSTVERYNSDETMTICFIDGEECKSPKEKIINCKKKEKK